MISIKWLIDFSIGVYKPLFLSITCKTVKKIPTFNFYSWGTLALLYCTHITLKSFMRVTVICLRVQGAGSALMGRHTRFEGIVRGMVEVLECPLTVKMRTGIYNKNWNAHKLVAKLKDWGVSLMTVSQLANQ